MSNEDVTWLPHRDDVDADIVHEIERILAEEFPGMKVVFAGDIPPEERPAGLNETIEVLRLSHERSLVFGECLDCRTLMPDYDPGQDGWEPPDGWMCMMSGETIIAWICPECSESA